VLAGNMYDNIYQVVSDLLSDKKLYDEMSHANNPYGDGASSSKIYEIIHEVMTRVVNI